MLHISERVLNAPTVCKVHFPYVFIGPSQLPPCPTITDEKAETEQGALQSQVVHLRATCLQDHWSHSPALLSQHIHPQRVACRNAQRKTLHTQDSRFGVRLQLCLFLWLCDLGQVDSTSLSLSFPMRHMGGEQDPTQFAHYCGHQQKSIKQLYSRDGKRPGQLSLTCLF